MWLCFDSSETEVFKYWIYSFYSGLEACNVGNINRGNSDVVSIENYRAL